MRYFVHAYLSSTWAIKEVTDVSVLIFSSLPRTNIEDVRRASLGRSLSCASSATSSAAGGATSIADESGSHQILMLDEIVVEQCARWDYKTNMTLGASREHTGRKNPLDKWDAKMFSQELQGSCGGGKRQRL
ncbi:hypothetical protein B0H14DRAFT_2651608 [Mycena olivaceomarginata]|nr:hypothetical protein B0H14DRAFT_2651608 [Mycena olivaceomarginata]